MLRRLDPASYGQGLHVIAARTQRAADLDFDLICCFAIVLLQQPAQAVWQFLWALRDGMSYPRSYPEGWVRCNGRENAEEGLRRKS